MSGILSGSNKFAYFKHGLESCALGSSDCQTSLIQLLDGVKRFGLAYNAEERSVGGVEIFEEKNTPQHHQDENQPGTQILWRLLLALENWHGLQLIYL